MSAIDVSLMKSLHIPVDEVWRLMVEEATILAQREPLMRSRIQSTILSRSSLKDALSFQLAKLCAWSLSENDLDPWIETFRQVYETNIPDVDNIEELAKYDLYSVFDRDPACDGYLTVFLYFKGFKALQGYRVAHVLHILGRRDLALLIQSRCSEVYGVDIHPAAKIGRGLMIDHGTGVVIGETAVIGDNCSILHNVTLGSTGKAKSVDRHPKVGDDVLIGCGASILGNISVGSGSKIGCATVVLKPLPEHVTAVGNPARVVGQSLSPKAGSSMEHAFYDCDLDNSWMF